MRLTAVCLYCFSTQAQELELHKIQFKPNGQLTGNYVEVKEANLSMKGASVLHQSSDQTVWIGTEGAGLISYTGNAIRRYLFNPKDTASLPGDQVFEIWEESPAALWISTNSGIAKLDRLSGRFTRFASQSRFVRKGAGGVLYTSISGQGLFRIDTLSNRLHKMGGQAVRGANGTPYPGENMAFIHKLEVDKEGTLWAVGKTKTLEGLFHFDAKTASWVFHEPAFFYVLRLDKNPVQIHKVANRQAINTATLYIDASNRIWFGGWHTGLFCYDIKSGKWQQYVFYRNKAQTLHVDNVVLNIYPLNKTELWISSYYNGFVLNLHNKTAYNYTYLEGMGTVPPFKKQMAYTLRDHCGSQWVTDGNGVFKSNPVQDRFRAVNKDLKPVMRGEVVTAFWQLGPEHYLVAANGPELADGRFKTGIYEIAQGRMANRFLVTGTVRQFIPAGKNVFWAFGMELYTLNLKKGTLHTMPIKVAKEASASGLTFDFFNNVLWNDSILFTCRRTTANAGLVKVNLKKREAQLYKTASAQLSPGLPQDNSIVRLMKDSYNRIWCGAAGGVDIFYPDTEIFEHYAAVEGDSTSLIGTQAPRMCETADRTFYVASRSGVCATKALPGTRATFTPIAYLDCEWIVADKANMLWVGTPQGVARINPRTKTYKLFGVKDGFYWNAAHKPLVMPDGRFMMHDGAVIDPTAITQNTFKPLPRLSDFLVAGQPVSLDTTIEFKQHIRLKHDQNFFSIAYTCNNYISEEDNTFRYRLQGVDAGWVDAGSRTTAYYTSLAPGSYQFYVQAANNDGIWGEPKKLLTLTLVPAWYQTAWFKIGAALLIITAVYAFYRQRLLKERARHLAEKREAELKHRDTELKRVKSEFDKQLAETQMAALRSQMNPHFIFNVLNSINNYILGNDKRAASAYLVQFSRLIRLTLENSMAAKVSLHNELEALRIYIEMEKLRFDEQFTFAIELDKNIDPQFLHIPPLLIQPYVENAIWHGLMQHDSPGHLLVQVTQPEDTLLKIEVQDNGIGRARAAALKSKSATARKSYGLQITSDRLQLVNRLHGVQATAMVEDLFDTAGQPAGTKVTLQIPV